MRIGLEILLSEDWKTEYWFRTGMANMITTRNSLFLDNGSVMEMIELKIFTLSGGSVEVKHPIFKYNDNRDIFRVNVYPVDKELTPKDIGEFISALARHQRYVLEKKNMAALEKIQEIWSFSPIKPRIITLYLDLEGLEAQEKVLTFDEHYFINSTEPGHLKRAFKEYLIGGYK